MLGREKATAAVAGVRGHAGTSAREGPGVGVKIVLTDDEPDLRAIYAGALRREGFEVWEASDGTEALELVAAQRPDLLLLDVWMPAVNGFEVLDRLRYDPCATTMKVVMLSNLCDADSRLEGYSGGVADYWVKGITLEELCERVRQLLAGLPAVPETP
jgi:DNA-binding response OmpR family regulator